MSLRRLIHKTPGFLAVFAFLFLRLASVEGAVACFGSDGHVALEGKHVSSNEVPSSDHKLGFEALRTVGPTLTQASLQERHDLPCLDVSVAHSGEYYAIGSAEPPSQIGPSAAIIPAYVGIKHSGTTSTTLFARAPPANSASVHYLRSVVLLI